MSNWELVVFGFVSWVLCLLVVSLVLWIGLLTHRFLKFILVKTGLQAKLDQEERERGE